MLVLILVKTKSGPVGIEPRASRLRGREFYHCATQDYNGPWQIYLTSQKFKLSHGVSSDQLSIILEMFEDESSNIYFSFLKFDRKNEKILKKK